MILLLPMKIQIISTCVFGKVNFALRAHALLLIRSEIRAQQNLLDTNLSINLVVHNVRACALNGKKTVFVFVQLAIAYASC